MRNARPERAEINRQITRIPFVATHSTQPNGRNSMARALGREHDKKPLIAVRDHGSCKHLIFPDFSAKALPTYRYIAPFWTISHTMSTGYSAFLILFLNS